MAKKIVAIIGTYRKGRTIDTAVAEVLRGAADNGAQTEKVYLIDKHIEFCTNCRACTQDRDAGRRGTCTHEDDMAEILQAIDEADGLVLGAPTNFFGVNALTKRFMERLIPYAYWPWEAKRGPSMRVRKPDKKAVTLTATACPSLIARLLIRGPLKALKIAAWTMGAKVQTALLFGGAAHTPEATLDAKGLRRAYRAGERLAKSLL